MVRIQCLILIAWMASTTDVAAHECRKPRQPPRPRKEIKWNFDQIDKLKNPYTYPYFQLDVF